MGAGQRISNVGYLGLFPRGNGTLPNQASIVFWVKGDAGVYLDAGITPATNGLPVLQWNDQSASGYHLTQLTVGKQPTFLTNQLNGLPALSFDGTDDFLNRASVPFGSLTGMTSFVVTKFNNFTNYNVSLAIGYQKHELRSSPPTTSLSYTHVGPAGYYGPLIGRTPATGTWYKMGGRFNDSTNNTALWVNGSPSSSETDTNAFEGTMDLAVGARTDGTLPLPGYVAEAIIYPSALSDADMVSVFSYLTARYG